MIFVVVGTQFGFDRLVMAADDLAQSTGIRTVFQIGDGSYHPRNGEVHRRLDAALFNKILAEASVVVAHAGMGIVLSCLDRGIPIIVVPRRMALGEHRNDHQVDTAQRLAPLGLVSVCWDLDDLADLLVQARSCQRSISDDCRRLQQYIADFISDPEKCR